jgi:SAM-dependent methyltransferase
LKNSTNVDRKSLGFDGLAVTKQVTSLHTHPARSFSKQWQRFFGQDFERERLYGQTLDQEVQLFLSAFDLRHGDLEGRRILDAGCGSARLERGLSPFGAHVVALDAQDSIHLAAKRHASGHTDFVQADLMAPPFSPGLFDYVWSCGVLHCTGATEKGFNSLAGLVKPGGKLAVWLYSKDRFSPYLAARRFLPFFHRLPEPACYWLCWLLAIPLVLASPAAPLIRRSWRPINREAFANARFGFYDILTPRYLDRYRFDEVRSWFITSGFLGIQRWSELGVTGTKIKTANSPAKASNAASHPDISQ